MSEGSIKNKIDALLDREEDILAAAVAKSFKAYNESPTSANLRDYQANKKALEELRSSQNVDIISSKKEAVAYLIDEGWHIKIDGKGKNSKVYNHLDGLPRKGGGWLKKTLDTYAKNNLIKAEITPDEETGSAEKMRQEIRVAAARAEKLEMENEILQGKFIERSKVNRELVSRMIQLRKDEKTDNKVKAADIIALVGGDIEKETELQKYLNDMTDKRLNKYAKPIRFNVGVSELEKEIALIEAEEANAG